MNQVIFVVKRSDVITQHCKSDDDPNEAGECLLMYVEIVAYRVPHIYEKGNCQLTKIR